MDEDIFSPFDESQLSPEDQEVLRMFDALEDIPANLDDDAAPESGADSSHSSLPAHDSGVEAAEVAPASSLIDENFIEDMLSVFAFEADEDIAILRRTLRQIEREDRLDTGRLMTLQHLAHKIKGTAGAVGCFAMSTIAYQIEAIARLIGAGTVNQLIGLKALVQAVLALEVTLDGLIADRVEHTDSLEELQAEYRALGIDVEASGANAPPSPASSTVFSLLPGKRAVPPAQRAARAGEEIPLGASFVRIDTKRFEQLLRHTERIAELQAPLEQAQAQVEQALKELQAAQVRLRRLETIFTTVTLTAKNEHIRLERQILSEELPSSSLVARILHEATERTGHLYQRRSRQKGLPGKAVDDPRLWDELEIEHYTENEVLMQQFSEAIADVATASSQLRLAFSRLQDLLQLHRSQASNVRSDTLLLRLTPLNALFARLQRAIMMSAQAQAREIQFEMQGETVEIDQDVLEELKNPLLQLVRDCVTGSMASLEEDEQDRTGKESKRGEESKERPAYRVWLHVQTLGHEIALELGFSMPVPGGVLDAMHEVMRRLNGRIHVQRNATGGISFFLHLPRSQGTVQGLLVRAAGQQVVVPFSQVQQIDDGRGEEIAGDRRYLLNDLLHFPSPARQEGERGTPLLDLPVQPGQPRLLVEVEEVCGSAELVVRPLPEHLQRPGITGAAIDGNGNVLLLLNLPELVHLYRHHQGRDARAVMPVGEQQRATHTEPGQTTILVADDSVFIRQWLSYSLTQLGYQVEEAHDGMEALEKLLALHPAVLILDIEMPNLNGYDLLNILPAYPELADIKILILTSRSSEKHRERARQLGASAYLTKPCPQNVLEDAIKSVLGR